MLRARLCRRAGQPVPTSRAAVTDIDIESFLEADGPGVAHVGEAMAQFPNLARMHAHGFEGWLSGGVGWCRGGVSGWCRGGVVVPGGANVGAVSGAVGTVGL